MTHPERDFEDLGGERLLGREVVDVERRRFRFMADGKEVDRDVVRHPGGVAVVAHDGEHVLLVRQPRPAVGEPDLLEIPAGRLDHAGEPPLEAARRELAEETGRSARCWTAIARLYPSADVLDAEVHVFLAEELGPGHADSGEDERIEVVPWPLDRLDEAIAATRDAKTLVGLLALARRLEAPR
ncbi:MAG TPA: NUDIX hydrolase [Baekduia sp.]|nr:NUDIX hydrolase [Baekduia sp.]